MHNSAKTIFQIKDLSTNGQTCRLLCMAKNCGYLIITPTLHDLLPSQIIEFPMKITVNATAYKDILDHCVLPIFQLW